MKLESQFAVIEFTETPGFGVVVTLRLSESGGRSATMQFNREEFAALAGGLAALARKVEQESAGMAKA